MKNFPPEKETKRIVYKKQKKARKKRSRRNLKGFKISTLHEAEILTVPSQILGLIRSWNI